MRISVRTPGGNYEAIVERGGIEAAGQHLQAIAAGKRLFAVTTDRVWRHQGDRLARGLRGARLTRLTMPDGEGAKRLATIEALADRMLAAGADRSSVVLAFGGGVVNDAGGFLAAIYMRGIDVIQVPTTLLAQVDAAIGGKTGVNLAEGKNLIGAFHQPRLVLIDPAALDTLPEREYRAGLFEVIKCAIIRSRPLFDLLAGRRSEVLERNPEVVDRLIGESVRIKAEIVSADEREGDLRRILNFGHTVGHALEAETHYERLLHGEAVAYGMSAALKLAERAGVMPAGEAQEAGRLIASYAQLPGLNGVSVGPILARLGSDKKTVAGRVHFVLADGIGKARMVSGLDESLIRSAIAETLEEAV